MWKWIAGGCLGLILVVCLVLWAGYRKMKAFADKGPAVSVMIASDPHRIFASLATADSLGTWRLDGASMMMPHRGPLNAGDTLTPVQRGGRASRMVWIVTAVTPDQVIGFDAFVVDSGPMNGRPLFSRRDSVAAKGDSTMVVSTLVAMVFDSLKTMPGARGAGPVGQGAMGIAATMGTAGFRIQAEQELKRLKSRIEGSPLPPEGDDSTCRIERTRFCLTPANKDPSQSLPEHVDPSLRSG